MSIYFSYKDLPDRIRNSTVTAKILTGKLQFLFKTTYKPSHSIPIVWFLMYSDGIMLRATYAKSIFKEISVDDINCIKLHDYGSNVNLLEIIYNDINADNFLITIPKHIDIFELENLIKPTGINVINTLK